MEQHREFAGADHRLGGRRRRVRRAARARAVAGRAGERPWPRRATAARRRCWPGTTATSSGSTARAATPSPPGSTPCSTASASIPMRPGPGRSPALSGGERGRLGLAQQLVAPADVLLLDEPTNHLDLETTRWLEDYLRRLDATVLLISHDRAFLAGRRGSRLPPRSRDRRGLHRRLRVRSSASAPNDGCRSSGRSPSRRGRSRRRRTIIRRNIAGQNSAQAKGRRRRLERVGA